MNGRDRMQLAEALRRRGGGEWLGVVRSFIQQRAIGGDVVTWGSDDLVRVRLTVRDFEDLAQRIAAATLAEAGVTIGPRGQFVHPAPRREEEDARHED